MFAAELASPSFVLPLDCPIKWTSTQEKAIHRDYPFSDARAESAQQRVVQAYLEYLWLPESLMPLVLLVPALRRIAPSNGVIVHPLHALLDPLLHTVRSCATKYQQDIAGLITAGESEEPEEEESMFWYAFNHARRADDNASTSNQAHDEEKEKKEWLTQMEHRETKIQILLYFLKLSLSGSQDPPFSPSKHDSLSENRRRRKPAEPSTPSLEERLESFMDKLAMWQLMHSLEVSDIARKDSPFDGERDWTQRFCEDIVEPTFSTALPKLCALLRSKVFPHSPFSGDSDTESESLRRSSSPMATFPDNDAPISTTAPMQKRPRKSQSRALSQAGSLRSLSERTRSLSVTLEQERKLRRVGSAGPGRDSASTAAANSHKRAFSREVSMSRTFRAREASTPATEQPMKSSTERAEKKAREEDERRRAETGKKGGVTLVAETPAKAVRIADFTAIKNGPGDDDGGLLVEATPTKPRKGRGIVGGQ